METETSKRLLDRYLQGNTLAEGEIDQRYRTRIILLARKQLFATISAKLDPEDVAQESLLTFFSMLESGNVNWSQRGDLWRLLSGIVINKVRRAYEYYSAAKRNVGRESSSDPETVSTALDQEMSIELNEFISVLFDDEKPLIKTVLKLKLAGWTQQEIANRVSRSERTVRRVLESIRGKIAGHHDFAQHLADRGSDADVAVQPNESNRRSVGAKDRHSASERHLASVPEVSFGNVQLLRLIGQGAFSKVYLGCLVAEAKYVAIKVMRPNQPHSHIVRQTFQNECNLLSRFRHPGFVALLGYGQLPNGHPFLVLELLYRELAVGSQVNTGALRAAVRNLHARGFIHADLKRAHILYSKDATATLIDFGFARPVDRVGESEQELQQLKRILADQIESSL